jgi:hypothetical protein
MDLFTQRTAQGPYDVMLGDDIFPRRGTACLSFSLNSGIAGSWLKLPRDVREAIERLVIDGVVTIAPMTNRTGTAVEGLRRTTPAEAVEQIRAHKRSIDPFVDPSPLAAVWRDSLIGKFGLGPAPQRYQFQIKSRTAGGRYLVQLFSWVDGYASAQQIVPEAWFLGAQLFDDAEQWRQAAAVRS